MKNIIILLAVLLIVLPAGLSAQNKFALVIGNGDYSGISKLITPVNDANDMEAALKSLGFNVTKVIDGSRGRMEDAVKSLKRQLSASVNSYGFFFFSGHAVQARGGNYLIPVKASSIYSDTSLHQRAVSLQFVLDSLKEAGNIFNMIVLDACRDNPFVWSDIGSRGLSAADSLPQGLIVMYAAKVNSAVVGGSQTTRGNSGRNSLFTGHLLKNLKNTGFSADELFYKTKDGVVEDTGGKQDPELYIRFSAAPLTYLGTNAAAETAVEKNIVQDASAAPPDGPVVPSVQISAANTSVMQDKRDKLIKEAEALLSTPYKSPCSPPNNFDCSTYVSYVYSKLGYTVPRQSSSYGSVGKKIDWEDAQPGDILLFSSSKGSSKIDHVAILYKKSTSGSLAGSWLIHSASINTGASFKQGNASSKTGVVITELGLRGDGKIENEYFYQRYMYTTRVLD